MLQHPMQYQLILSFMYDTRRAELLLTKASTLCPNYHSTNLSGCKVLSNNDVPSDVQVPMYPQMGGSNSKMAIHLSKSPFVDQGTESYS